MKIEGSLCLAVVLAAGPFLPRFAAGQEQAAGKHEDRMKVRANEVSLPVTVIDKRGALVTNLTVKDLTLTEDGRPQAITSLTTQSQLPFKLGLLADTSRGVSAAMDAERKANEKLVDQMLPAGPEAAAGAPASQEAKSSVVAAAATALPGSQAFLIHFDREVELLEDFTGSREKLHRELDEMGPTSHERNERGPESSGDDRGGYGGNSQRGGAEIYDAIYLASDELMKPAEGRKALVVFSDGLDRGSKETLNDAVDAADRAGVQVFTIYFRGEAERQGNGFPGGGHHGGGGYPGGGNPGGGGGRHGDEQQQADGKKVMAQIAQRTGGQFFEAKKKENLDEIYDLVAGALRQQYLLTYTPDKADSESEFHHVTLKANSSDLTVVTREGYYSGEERSSLEGSR